MEMVDEYWGVVLFCCLWEWLRDIVGEKGGKMGLAEWVDCVGEDD